MLETLKNVEIFAAGTFHQGTPMEVTFTDQDLVDIVRNYNRLSAGPRPLVDPFVKVGRITPHGPELVTFEEGTPAAAWVRNVRKLGPYLYADLVDALPSVIRDLKARKWKYVSAEIDKYPGMHPQFKVGGAVLRALVLVNNPGVKGIRPITIRHDMAGARMRTTFFCFSEFKGASMDRQQMLDYLATQGVDVALITDAVTDDILQLLVKAYQDLEAAKGQTNPEMAGKPAGPPAGDSRLPTKIIQQFSELSTTVDSLNKTLATVELKISAADKAAADRARAEHERFVCTFADQAVQSNFLTPADVERDKTTGAPLPHTMLAQLLRADHSKRFAFTDAAGATVQKTDLELQMDRITKGRAFTFSEKIVAAGGNKKTKFDLARERGQKRMAAGKPELPVEQRLGMLPPAAMR